MSIRQNLSGLGEEGGYLIKNVDSVINIDGPFGERIIATRVMRVCKSKRHTSVRAAALLSVRWVTCRGSRGNPEKRPNFLKEE